MSEKFVKNILDVPGVEGVCVFDDQGAVIFNELPSFFIEDLFDDLVRRVLSLYETVDENFVPCDDYLLKYSERWIFLRRGNGVFLLVFAMPAVNRVSLKMVTNLAIKNLKPSRNLGAPRTANPSSGAAARAPGPASVQGPNTPASTPPSTPPAPAEPSAEASASEPNASPSAHKRVARPRPKRSFRGSSY